MAFQIVAQTNTSENNHIDKQLTTIGTYSGVLRDGCSIIDPVIVVEAGIDELIGCNYLTIAEFGRSYFVRNISSIRSQLTELSCHVDVLSSFASEIRANVGIVRRAESDDLYNLYLDDGSLAAYQDPYILTEPFPAGFSGAKFVLAVAGSA